LLKAKVHPHLDDTLQEVELHEKLSQ